MVLVDLWDIGPILPGTGADNEYWLFTRLVIFIDNLTLVSTYGNKFILNDHLFYQTHGI